LQGTAVVRSGHYRRRNPKGKLDQHFEDIGLPKFPGETPPLTLFAKFTDAEGIYEIAFEVRDLERDTAIADIPSQPLEIAHRLDTVNVLMTFLPIPLPHAGAYDVIALIDGQATEHQRFIATLTEDY
jgi:hypothetical protein